MSDTSQKRLSLSAPVIAGNEWTYVKDCLDTGWVSSGGSYVSRFEESLARLTGAPYAVACQSGTAALHVALLLHGVGAGDAVIVPAATFIATCNAVAYTGARPVFVDCDEYLNIDPASVARYLAEGCEPGERGPVDRETGLVVRAIMPVHIFGSPCDMAAIQAIADEHGLVVVEDAAESLGSRWSAGPLAGRHTGTIGRMGAISFNGNKIATTGGGGALVTFDEELAARARHLTTQAKVDTVRFVHDEVGYNYRLTNVAAAMGVAQLEQLPGFIATKRRNRDLYIEALAGVPGVSVMDVPPGTEPNYWFYSLLIEPSEAGADREAVMAHLASAGIESRPLWHPNNLQAPYRDDRAWRIERTIHFHDRVLNVPCSSDLTEDDVVRVCDAIRDVCRGGSV
jgi:perosamine synthetase